MSKIEFKYEIKSLGDYIDGSFRESELPNGYISDVSPADLNDQIMKVPYWYGHIEEACRTAKGAFPAWARLSVAQRTEHLLRLKELFIANEDRMAECISRDVGKPLWEAMTEAKALSQKIEVTLKHSMKLVAEERIENALPGVEGVIRYKARGVMAVIGPFNFPAHLPNGHIIPALAMGNTVVFKPSEQAPAVGQLYAEILSKAGLPHGVFNLIQGDAESGRKLVASENVDGILFTGSYDVGLRIKQETMTHYWKILALEMGGKNATVVWSDADIEKALYETLIGAFLTSGQRCSCTSRIILHDKIANEFTDRFYQAAKQISIGHWKENVFMGPLINAVAVEKYLRFQEIAKREDCESLMRGKALDLKHKGYYVTPSINLVNAFNPNSVYQKSEIFGPNVAIYKTHDFDETLKIVNSTGYGLVLALFSKDKTLYDEAAFRANVGLLNWNRTTNGASSRLPFGGTGKSGNDRPSAHFAVQYCSVPMANLEDPTPFDSTKLMPGLNYGATTK
jgi:succinylglutamic semialdehyde dehydrogenase